MDASVAPAALKWLVNIAHIPKEINVAGLAGCLGQCSRGGRSYGRGAVAAMNCILSREPFVRMGIGSPKWRTRDGLASGVWNRHLHLSFRERRLGDCERRLTLSTNWRVGFARSLERDEMRLIRMGIPKSSRV
jgi:hypothetical protein